MCFRCGKPGHIVVHCTEPPKNKDDQDKNKKVKARVFALNQHEAEQDLNVIAGILSLSDVPTYVLFDFEATNSFISASFIARSNLRSITSGEEEFHFFGAEFKSLPRLVLAIQADKILKMESCQGFLVNINVSKHAETTIKDINIVRDFIDVFPEDLLGIPQDRQVEFTIDLVPCAAPVSKAPHRMTWKELQKLKLQ
ncbi:uncharacterized protein LOC111389079 [Olea europaea var. sylvestris]|uniref:uncharacterized protein LOC111389079 n=1 Tax=Olea europaea var. sylvestris TaxID=158386 RepID=UPI000C1D1A0F|nr:uncharacterized protein LOC111389079 [Olea europaea var. sylvestris]